MSTAADHRGARRSTWRWKVISQNVHRRTSDSGSVCKCELCSWHAWVSLSLSPF